MTSRDPAMTRAALGMLLLIAAACNTTSDPGTGTLTVLQGGNNQWAAPSSPLPSAIGVALEVAGDRQHGVTVSFSTTAGTISPSTTTTGTDGIASATWTLPAGATPRAVQATVHISRPGVEDVKFTAFVVPAGNAVVTVTNNLFNPVSQTIANGQAVTWLWFDGATGHNVTPLGLEPPTSGALRDGPFVYTYAFPTSGNYTFYCQAHGTPSGTGMAGVITVQPPG